MLDDFELRWLTSADGLRLRCAVDAPVEDCRGLIVVLGGRTEFIEKYREFVGDLRVRGLRAVLMDWRGQGLSDRMLDDRHRGFVEDFSQYVDDLEQLFDEVVLKLGDAPRLLFGHSMGGHIALRFLHRRPDAVAGAIFSAPMIDLPLSAHVRLFAAGMSRLATALGLGGRYLPGYGGYDIARRREEIAVLTSDVERFEESLRLIESEPDLALGGPTYGWLNAALRSIRDLSAKGVPEAITTRSLFIAAADEAVVCNDAIRGLVTRMPNADLHLLEAAQHELLMERELVRQQLLSEIDRFLLDTLGPASAIA
ncbi:MAG: alpha/beta fold hydrolase [Geminicoccaceae bacterium]